MVIPTFKIEKWGKCSLKPSFTVSVLHIDSYMSLCGEFRCLKMILGLIFVPDQKPFSCSTCGKGFTRKAYLLEHEARHKGLKDRECPVI